MPEFALIACRVTSQTKACVRRLAEREGITESALLRQLLDVALQTAGLDEPPTREPLDKVNRDARVNVRLEPEDWRLLRSRARARGMASATYLSYLARSHLRGAAPLPKMEYRLVTQSMEQVAAVSQYNGGRCSIHVIDFSNKADDANSPLRQLAVQNRGTYRRVAVKEL